MALGRGFYEAFELRPFSPEGSASIVLYDHFTDRPGIVPGEEQPAVA